jgi:prepilin-type N-terminal cleavage/methylation domain-containing protein
VYVETKFRNMFDKYNKKAVKIGNNICFQRSVLNATKSAGFTLIELMVVIAVMVILYSVLTINLTSNRSPLNLQIAADQLVTNIKEAQSYTLSSRLLPSGQSAQYYLIKFNLATSTQYTIQAIYNVDSQPQLIDVETVNLPANIILAVKNPLVINSNGTNMKPASCALISFATPYAQLLLQSGCNPSGYQKTPYTIQSSDDYYKILNYNNAYTSCPLNPTEPCSDSIMTITLTDTSNTISQEILVNGITGVVCPAATRTTCATTSY